MCSTINVATTYPKARVVQQLSITSNRFAHDVMSVWAINIHLMNGTPSSHLRYLGGDDGLGKSALG